MVGRRRGVERGGGARNQDRMDENTSMEFGRRGPKRGLTEDPREDRAQRRARRPTRRGRSRGERGSVGSRNSGVPFWFTLHVLGAPCWDGRVLLSRAGMGTAPWETQAADTEVGDGGSRGCRAWGGAGN